ncbi:YidC/Oxa1 family membrane protein insertase, partial [Patescibacteria group bacterium]|nr:YidC/Oxa1 family membrane protein insertase [Patescibacteria group bacterium]
MMYIMPVVTVFIGVSLPGGLTLYWLIMSLLTVAQQAVFLRKPKMPSPVPQLS